MKKIFLLIAVACQALSTAVLAGDISGSVKSGGKTRTYIGYLPNNMGEGRPMLISCHGMNQDGPYQKNMLDIKSVADTAKFLTIFPQGEGNSWDIGGDKDIQFMKDLIDDMVDKYKIDRKRVYLSGFSMGGMFTYHAMNRIPDLIAAFAPISGYSMGGTTANANARPLPLIHTHGTTDDVVGFSGVQGALNAWIKHNNCPTTAKVTQRYRNASHITRRVWGPGDNGVEVVLMEMANKGHWISNDNGVKTGDEIWRFCSRYSLDIKDPTVKFTSPQEGLSYVAFGGDPEVPGLTLTAKASDPDGQVAKVTFYDGSEELAVIDKAPYTYKVEQLASGTHEFRAIVTDDEGRTGYNTLTVEVTKVANNSNYSMHKVFTNNGGGVPAGWTTYDGKEKRTGPSSGYSTGSRVFQFTGEQHTFVWGLYTRNIDGKKKAGYARYGAKESPVSMTLYPGMYQLQTITANWNQPDLMPITVAVETVDGEEVFSQTFTPKANIGNSASNSFTGATNEKLSFSIKEKGRYVVTYYTSDASWADLVVGSSFLKRTGDIPAAIADVEADGSAGGALYNLSGQAVSSPTRGIYIRNGKKLVVK